MRASRGPSPLTTGDSLDLAALPWRSFEIPGGSPSVRLTRLEVDDGGGFTVVVRFPAGWIRPGPGRYDADEEVLFLAGEFEMNSDRYVAGDHAWFPASLTRVDSRSSAGALALAWFSRPNRWTEGVADEVEQAARDVERADWTQRETVASPLGVPGRRLRSDDHRSSWILDELPAPVRVPDGLAAVDVFDLVTHRYRHHVTGQMLPAIGPGPVWARLIVRDTDRT